MRLPQRYLMRMAFTLGVTTFTFVAVLVLTALLLDAGRLVGVAIGLTLAILFAVCIAYVWAKRSYLAVYPDRVVINGRTFRREDVLWLDIYEVEEQTSYVRLGSTFMINTAIISEMVFAVAGPSKDEEFTIREMCSGLEAQGLAMELRRYLPHLHVERHEGVEDRTPGAAIDMALGRFSRRRG